MIDNDKQIQQEDTSAYVISDKSITNSLLKQRRLSSLLADLDFDIRRWKTLLAVADNQGEPTRVISKKANVSFPCCTGHLLDMSVSSDKGNNSSKYYPLVKLIGSREIDNLTGYARDRNAYLTENAVLFFSKVNQILGEAQIIDSDVNVVFSGDTIWTLDDSPVVYLELSLKSAAFEKEFEKFSNSLPEFKMPIVCAVSNERGDKQELTVYIDQNEALWASHDNIIEKRYFQLGDSYELSGDKFFKFFEARVDRIGSKI